MKSAVIYNSQTGFTKKYAEWLSEELNCESISFEDAKNKNFSDYEVLIFGSWVHASKIKKLEWFKNLMDQFRDKIYAVYAVGASPIESKDIEPSLEKNIPKEEYDGRCKAFYCPGGINYGKMSFIDKTLMKGLAKVLKSKKNATTSEKEMAEMISHDYDISDKKYIEPILLYINS